MCKACHSCIRILMMVFNFIFVLCGLGLFAIGLYFYLGTFFKNMSTGGTSMLILFYVIMGIGTFTLIVGACGCCGAYHESPCLLGTYFVLLLIIFAAEIAGGIICFKYSEKVQDNMKMAFENGVKEMIDRTDNSKEHWFDEAQKMMNCCGHKSAMDYWDKFQTKIPNSCCAGKCSFASKEEVQSYERVGCKKAWDDIIDKRWMIFAGVLLGIALIELFGLIFSMCLCCSARSIEYDIVETRA